MALDATDNRPERGPRTVAGADAELVSRRVNLLLIGGSTAPASETPPSEDGGADAEALLREKRLKGV